MKVLTGVARYVLIATWVLVSGCVSQQTFSSPDEAADALVRGLREGNDDQLKKILGSNANDLLFSGDEVADENAVERFLNAYDQKHWLVPDAEGGTTIVVGNDDWPLPIPITKGRDQRWSFDTEAGKDEIITRRIGANELDVIEVCKAIVDAQNEYAMLDTDGDGVSEYAQKFLSDPGQKNGLFWPTDEGQPASPLGPLVAEAAAEGYELSPNPTGKPQPYHGYCYRMLKSQGANAPDGAMDYVINGKMIGGFAVVAYPADHDN